MSSHFDPVKHTSFLVLVQSELTGTVTEIIPNPAGILDVFVFTKKNPPTPTQTLLSQADSPGGAVLSPPPVTSP